MRSSFVCALREEKLRATEIIIKKNIIHSQSYSSSVAHSMFVCPTAETAHSSLQCQTIFPSQYTIHYDSFHLSLRNVWESPGINSSEREHIPLNKAGCTLKLPHVRNNSAFNPCFGGHGSQWLKCSATNRKVAGSNPAGVIGFFIDIKSFRSHYSL